MQYVCHSYPKWEYKIKKNVSKVWYIFLKSKFYDNFKKYFLSFLSPQKVWNHRFPYVMIPIITDPAENTADVVFQGWVSTPPLFAMKTMEIINCGRLSPEIRDVWAKICINQWKLFGYLQLIREVDQMFLVILCMADTMRGCQNARCGRHDAWCSQHDVVVRPM